MSVGQSSRKTGKLAVRVNEYASDQMPALRPLASSWMIEMAAPSDKVQVSAENPAAPECLRLIAQLTAELAQLYGDDGGANSFNPLDALGRAAIFFVARIEGQAVGCGALRSLERGVGEVKRMFVVPEARGQGISRLILQHLESAAIAMGYNRLRLETGIRQPEAIGLYESSGYYRTSLYGQYINDPR